MKFLSQKLLFVCAAAAALCCVSLAQGTALVFTATIVSDIPFCPEFDPPVHLLVNWGDGTDIEPVNTTAQNFCHTYATNGTFVVSFGRDTSDPGITQWLGSFRFTSRYLSHPFTLEGIDSFGDLGITSLSYVSGISSNAFYVPTILPSSVIDLSYTFYQTDTFNSANVSLWDVSAVTSLSRTFAQAISFNQPLHAWNTSSVTDMSKTFDTSRAFNQPLNSWDTSKVKNMENMFEEADVFNQPIFNWDTSSVTNMVQMFKQAYAFNQDISSWNVSQVAQMDYMFDLATAFNQNLTAWCVQKILSEPFSFNSSLEWTLLPIWGTCPPPAPRPASPVAPPAAAPVASPVAAPVTSPVVAPVSVPTAAPLSIPVASPVATPQATTPQVAPSSTPTFATRVPNTAPTLVSAASTISSISIVALSLSVASGLIFPLIAL